MAASSLTEQVQSACWRGKIVSIDQTFSNLKSFLESSSAIKNTMNALKDGTEFGITIGDVVQCALTRKDEQILLERRPAEKPDLIFYIKPESAAVITSQNPDQISALGATVMKEILAGNIHVELTSNLRALLDHGYVEMLRKTGGDWANKAMEIITQQAFTHMMKASAAFENFKKVLKLDGR